MGFLLDGLRRTTSVYVDILSSLHLETLGKTIFRLGKFPFRVGSLLLHTFLLRYLEEVKTDETNLDTVIANADYGSDQ